MSSSQNKKKTRHTTWRADCWKGFDPAAYDQASGEFALVGSEPDSRPYLNARASDGTLVSLANRRALVALARAIFKAHRMEVPRGKTGFVILGITVLERVRDGQRLEAVHVG